MIKYLKNKLDLCFDTLRGFFQENNPAGSSKRLTFILSFLSSIGICWFSLITGMPIDSTVMSLSISVLTISTGGYLIGKKGAPTKDATSDAKEEAKDGQG
jgi:hypothetical protein